MTMTYRRRISLGSLAVMAAASMLAGPGVEIARMKAKERDAEIDKQRERERVLVAGTEPKPQAKLHANKREIERRRRRMEKIAARHAHGEIAAKGGNNG